jgi:hypothetical protein
MFPRLKKSLLLLMLFASLGFSHVKKLPIRGRVEIAYYVQGTRTAIVFLFTDVAAIIVLDGKIRPLSSKYKVVAIDLAGHGQSVEPR